MPNWCSNQIVAVGSAADIDELKTFVANPSAGTEEDRVFSLASVIPLDTKDREDWYEARVSAWGTKWDASDQRARDFAVGDGLAGWSVCFSTAWAPSLPVTHALSLRFPNVRIVHEYSEPGMAFAGLDAFSNGEIYAQEEGESEFSLAVLARPGLVLLNPSYRSDARFELEPGIEAEQLTAQLDDTDPFRPPTALVDMSGPLEPATVIETMSPTQVGRALLREDADVLVRTWLSSTYCPSPTLSQWLSEVDVTADSVDAPTMALFTMLSLTNSNGGDLSWWESSGVPDDARFDFTQWRQLWESVLQARIHPPVALALVREILPQCDDCTSLTASLLEITARV